MSNIDNYAEQFARGFWLALLVTQFVFIVLWIAGVITWPWGLVFLPLWIFLSLPMVSNLTLIIAEMIEGSK